MFIQVKLLSGSSRSLWYEAPGVLTVGTIVQVPVRNTLTPALVTQAHTHPPKTSFDIKAITRIERFPQDDQYQSFLQRLGHYYQLQPLHFLKRLRSFFQQKKSIDCTPDQPSSQLSSLASLTDEQAHAAQYIQNALARGGFEPMVLHGLTGSGKTEVYKRAFQSCIRSGKSALLLLPEVTLALEIQQRIQLQLPDLPLFGFHSAVTASQKKAVWARLVVGQPTIIVGVHLPVLLPVAELGLIIVDEEHEVGYQEKKHPKINSKEAALLRAQQCGIPIVLGSATPSIATLHNAQEKGWKVLRLTKRFGGQLPLIKTVLLSNKKNQKGRPHFWVSNELHEAITQRLACGEQTIIFINRRGYCFFVQCKQCSHVFTCQSCSVSLTLHEDQFLRCHYCHFSRALPNQCPEKGCGARDDDLLKRGVGTQQVVSLMQALFPQATIARADMDTSSGKKQWEHIVTQLADGKIDILVGTQTIAKGFHFPNVTLVGILWADLNLNFPMYNASETTLQQLIQVAGRAGRSTQKSTVIVQAMAEHPIFNFLCEKHYPNFYEQEISLRQEVGYPPCMRLVEIELKHTDEIVLEREAHDIVMTFQAAATTQKLRVTVLGPARPPVHKIQNTFSRVIYLKGSSMGELIACYRVLHTKQFSSRIFFTPNPVT